MPYPQAFITAAIKNPVRLLIYIKPRRTGKAHDARDKDLSYPNLSTRVPLMGLVQKAYRVNSKI